MKLQLSNITHQFGDVEFCYNATITSSITGIYGPSGAGKSTLLNILCGIETPKGGEILFNEKTLFNLKTGTNIPVHKRKIGVVFQDNYLFPHLNVKQNLLYSQAYNKESKSNITIGKVVALLNIEPLLFKNPKQLSGGERQRVAIGRALLSNPELLLFDEPFSNLDRNRRKEIISYLLKINNQYKIPLLIVSHDLEDILRLTNSLLVVDQRRVVTTGNYIDVSESGLAPDIISHKRLLNVFDAWFNGYNVQEKLSGFHSNEHGGEIIFTNSDLLKPENSATQKVRLCISPDDIALSSEALSGTSIQNQIKGKVVKLFEIGRSVFVTIDCGFTLIAEISIAAYTQLQLEYGKEIYCLIKAKAIEVVHVFKGPDKT